MSPYEWDHQRARNAQRVQMLKRGLVLLLPLSVALLLYAIIV